MSLCCLPEKAGSPRSRIHTHMNYVSARVRVYVCMVLFFHQLAADGNYSSSHDLTHERILMSVCLCERALEIFQPGTGNK